MTYDDWKHGFTTAAVDQPQLRAQVWNLEHETRIDAEIAAFRSSIDACCDRLVFRREPDAEAKALKEAIDETKPIDSQWLGLLPVAETSTSAVPTEVWTYLTSRQMARFYTKGKLFDEHQPHTAPISLSSPLNCTRSPDGALTPVSRFIWITWAPGGAPLPDDPTQVKRQLGLAYHPDDSRSAYAEGLYVYRVPLLLGRARQRLFVPTCLDAHLGEAWAPPPRDFTSAWGLTRDLVSGEPRWPELLVGTADHVRDAPAVASLVSPTSAPVAIGPLRIDYMAGRATP